jgi:hypothetical protein
LTVPRAQGQVFRFYSPGLIFGGTEGARSSFHVLRSGLIFDDNKGVRSRFFVSFLDSFSAVPKVSSLVLIFCAPGPVFRATEDVGYTFLFFALPNPFSAI